MKFSVITVCKNAHESIRCTIESVLQQNYDQYEYIIIDGDSEDGTADIASSYSNLNMKVISEPDRGISDAFNKGIRASSGELIIFLNCGDYFINKSVLGIVAADVESHEADIYTYSIANTIDIRFPSSKQDGQKCWESSFIPHQGTFIRKDVFTEIGLFNENFKIRMDYDFFYRCRKAGRKFFCNPIVITRYDLNGISSTEKELFEKEGLAVRLLYDEKVNSGEREVIDSLVENKGDRETEYLKKIEKQKFLSEKDHMIMAAMYRWLRLVNRGWKISEYFERHNYHSIAIYGFGMLGKALREALTFDQTTVSYIIDQNVNVSEIEIISWDVPWEQVDCIVVTPIYTYEDIKKRIRREKGSYKTISFDDILVEAEQGIGAELIR